MTYHPVVAAGALRRLSVAGALSAPSVSSPELFGSIVDLDFKQSVYQAAQLASRALVGDSIAGLVQQNYLNAIGDEVVGAPTHILPKVTIVSSGTISPNLVYQLAGSRDFCTPSIKGSTYLTGNLTFPSVFWFDATDCHTNPAVERDLSLDYPWLAEVYAYAKAGSISKSLKTLYWGLEDLLAERSFLPLNRILQEIDLANLSPEVMIGLVRVTFRARMTLPEWNRCMGRIKRELTARKTPEWENLFVGL